ncbi:MAG TPA: FAD-dependent oxidoreductase, partial [Candidatus Methylomirabilis sp.]|nr:FAD-dependent oxidoreductase [Candidatus Methylomirabilis sp.]
MATDFDVVVIGSGFGGAVSACRLAEAGYRVLILERGRRWQVQDY